MCGGDSAHYTPWGKKGGSAVNVRRDFFDASLFCVHFRSLRNRLRRKVYTAHFVLTLLLTWKCLVEVANALLSYMLLKSKSWQVGKLASWQVGKWKIGEKEGCVLGVLTHSFHSFVGFLRMLPFAFRSLTHSSESGRIVST